MYLESGLKFSRKQSLFCKNFLCDNNLSSKRKDFSIALATLEVLFMQGKKFNNLGFFFFFFAMNP